MSARWPNPCKICKGMTSHKCLFCGWQKPKPKRIGEMNNAELAELNGLRNRKQFLFDLDCSSTKAGNCSTQLPEMDKFLEEHRKWCLSVISRVRRGHSLKSIAEDEQLTTAFIKNVVRMTNDKIFRGDFKIEVNDPVPTNILPIFAPTKRKAIDWQEEND